MVTHTALQHAAPYLDEEQALLIKLIEESGDIKRICVIGGGLCQYISLANKYDLKYTLVEPFLKSCFDKTFIASMKLLYGVTYVDKTFEEYCMHEKSPENTLYVFWFNVSWYINDLEQCLKKIVHKGDILFFSGWANTKQARAIQQAYFDYVYNDTMGIVPEPPTLGVLDNITLPYAQLKKIHCSIIEVSIVHII